MKANDFKRLIVSVKQAGRIRKGRERSRRTFEVRPADVLAIRRKLKCSQAEFAFMIGVSVATLQNWEQGRRRPMGPARALLKIAVSHPRIVVQALAS